MKTKEELNVLKEDVETINKKLTELTEEELAQLSGGNIEQDIKNMAKQYFQLDKEGFHDKAKEYLKRFGRYYDDISPKK